MGPTSKGKGGAGGKEERLEKVGRGQEAKGKEGFPNLTDCIRPWLRACITVGVRTIHFNLLCVLCLQFHDDDDDGDDMLM